MSNVQTLNYLPAKAPDAVTDNSVFAPDPHKPRRMNYGDAIRILGTIAVVIGHVADMRLFSTNPNEFSWRVANWWDALTRWAVPAYIMLSGALLLDPARAEPPQTFYKKRLARIGVPLVFWSAFFMWFAVDFTGWRTWKQAFAQLAEGKPYDHLHFIFRIAGLYAFTPMIRIFLRHSSRQIQWLSVWLLLGFSMADSVLNGVLSTAMDKPYEYSAFFRFVPFVGFYLLGYLMRDMRISRTQMILCTIGFFITAAILALGTHYLVVTRGYGMHGYPSLPFVLYDFLSPVRVAMAFCSWLVLTNLFHNPWPASKGGRDLVAYWSATTLGLYLVHPAVREMLYLRTLVPAFTVHHHYFGGVHIPLPEWFFAQWPNMWLGIPVTALLVYVPSLVITMIFMEIPVVRRITG